MSKHKVVPTQRYLDADAAIALIERNIDKIRRDCRNGDIHAEYVLGAWDEYQRVLRDAEQHSNIPAARGSVLLELELYLEARAS